MFVVGIGLSETTLGRFILNGNRDGVDAFFSGISLMRDSSFSNKRIFYVSEPPGNQVRRLALIFFLPARIFANRS
jgi:hypothetical protein